MGKYFAAWGREKVAHSSKIMLRHPTFPHNWPGDLKLNEQ